MSAAQGQGEGTPVNAERDRAWIAARIPHQGSMCLLDAVLEKSTPHDPSKGWGYHDPAHWQAYCDAVHARPPTQTPGPLGALAVGAVSGALNGAVGISGPPAIVFYFATTAVATSRATLIAYFLFTDVWALVLAGGAGLLTQAALPLIAVALPFSLAGIWLGQRIYLRLDEAQLRPPPEQGRAATGFCRRLAGLAGVTGQDGGGLPRRPAPHAQQPIPRSGS